MWNSSIGWFRAIAFMEGISYLVLLFIAMPLKYAADLPIYVTIVGAAHGGLFTAYIIALAAVWFTRRWSLWRVIGAFILSFIPFATFWLEKKLRTEQ